MKRNWSVVGKTVTIFKNIGITLAVFILLGKFPVKKD